jgi:hypothetical protein
MFFFGVAVDKKYLRRPYPIFYLTPKLLDKPGIDPPPGGLVVPSIRRGELWQSPSCKPIKVCYLSDTYVENGHPAQFFSMVPTVQNKGVDTKVYRLLAGCRGKTCVRSVTRIKPLYE